MYVFQHTYLLLYIAFAVSITQYKSPISIDGSFKCLNFASYFLCIFPIYLFAFKLNQQHTLLMIDNSYTLFQVDSS